MMTQIISTTLHLFWCNLFVMDFGWGVEGASLATCITYSTNFLCILIYTTLIDKELRQTWSYDPMIFKYWKSYLHLGIPGTLMIMLDWWVYEIINLESGYLKVEATAA